MRKVHFLACSVLALSLLPVMNQTLASAQTPTTPPAPAPKAAAHERGHAGMKRVEKLLDGLNLTDDQKAKIKPILLDAQQKIKSVREDKSLTPDQKKSQLKDNTKATWEKIKPILTTEQKEKLRAEMKDARAKHAAQAGGASK